jgi:hypothetical protein
MQENGKQKNYVSVFFLLTKNNHNNHNPTLKIAITTKGVKKCALKPLIRL